MGIKVLLCNEVSRGVYVARRQVPCPEDMTLHEAMAGIGAAVEEAAVAGLTTTYTHVILVCEDGSQHIARIAGEDADAHADTQRAPSCGLNPRLN